MKNTVLKFGIYSAIAITVLFLIGWFIGKGLDLGYSAQEVVGYASILVSLSFVFFGIKHFRDKENNGQVSFKKALVIGLLISLFASIAFGLVDIAYRYINPDFITEYYTHQVTALENSLSGVELEAALTKMNEEKELFSSTGISFLIMALTVFMIGVIVSLISSLVLQRK